MGILRLLLALAVVVEHSGTIFRGTALPGGVAVQAFFMISGFYIALILHRKYDFRGGTRLFYEQRYLRLAPIYWIAVLCTLGTGAFYSALAHHPVGKLQIWSEEGSNLSLGSVSILCLTQASMVGLDVLAFTSLSGHPLSMHLTSAWTADPLPALRFVVVPPAWSLSVELLFYMAAPFVVRRSLRFQLTTVAVAFGFRILAGVLWGLTQDPWSERFFPFEAGLFVLGSMAYQFLPVAERWMQRFGSARTSLTLVLAVTILVYTRIPLPTEVRRWAFLALVLVSIPLLFAATQRDTRDRCIGEISYPLYLLHQVTLFAAEPILRRTHGMVRDFVTLLLPLMVAAAAYALLERPFESWRARRYVHKSRHVPSNSEAPSTS